VDLDVVVVLDVNLDGDGDVNLHAPLFDELVAT
jgi:hypothetical protein